MPDATMQTSQSVEVVASVVLISSFILLHYYYSKVKNKVKKVEFDCIVNCNSSGTVVLLKSTKLN